jgi:hypothetical protein
MPRITAALSAALVTLMIGCATPYDRAESNPTIPPTAPGTELARTGDEIVICGRLFHTGGARVVLWSDPGGYDGYRVERRFVPLDQSSWEDTVKAGGPKTPNRFGLRKTGLLPEEMERVRGGGWDLPTLARVVDQFVLHYDASGTSRRCFRTLHDERGLSVHFLLDLDGTIYQTLDVKERAWHATVANDRAVGIEIASPGAFPDPDSPALKRWYGRDAGGVRITVPLAPGEETGFRVAGFVPRPARPEPVAGKIHGRTLHQYDFTPEQYDALIKLTATLCRVLLAIRPDCPRDAEGRPTAGKLDADRFAAHRGLLGHYHVQADKVDPGPAFDWDRLVSGVRNATLMALDTDRRPR